MPVAEFLGAHQVGVAERRRLALVTELLVGVGEQRARSGVRGVGEHQVVHQLGDPAVVARRERLARLRQQPLRPVPDLSGKQSVYPGTA